MVLIFQLGNGFFMAILDSAVVTAAAAGNELMVFAVDPELIGKTYLGSFFQMDVVGGSAMEFYSADRVDNINTGAVIPATITMTIAQLDATSRTLGGKLLLIGRGTQK